VDRVVEMVPELEDKVTDFMRNSRKKRIVPASSAHNSIIPASARFGYGRGVEVDAGLKRIFGGLLSSPFFSHAFPPCKGCKAEVSAASANLVTPVGRVLYEKMPMSGGLLPCITKLMTALVVLESTPTWRAVTMSGSGL
jgi:D-alanyl-D-alanine carboxypeptidase